MNNFEQMDIKPSSAYYEKGYAEVLKNVENIIKEVYESANSKERDLGVFFKKIEERVRGELDYPGIVGFIDNENGSTSDVGVIIEHPNPNKQPDLEDARIRIVVSFDRS
jgi:hypothetical protein